ncbi:MAG: general secretion pathway protein GspK [Gammaproteobacteria bacterium]|nr:general secretion pathway protein GspK [Gammaproteobacteria bacterium]
MRGSERITTLGRQRGVVLAIVLWLLALMTLLAGSYSMTARTEAELTARLRASAQARALAESGVWLAVRELLRPQQPDTWPAAGEIHDVAFENGMVAIGLQDEAGRIDLNAADLGLLYNLLQSATGDGNESVSVLQSILDWRDADDSKRKFGAEGEDYAAAGAGHAPRNGPFTAKDELRLVHGVDAELYDRLRGAVTVYSGQTGINPEVAVSDVLLALPGITPKQAEQYLAQRSAPDPGGAALPVKLDERLLSQARGRIVTITSAGQAAGSRVVLEAVVRIEAGRPEPYSVLSWREGNTLDAPADTDPWL